MRKKTVKKVLTVMAVCCVLMFTQVGCMGKDDGKDFAEKPDAAQENVLREEDSNLKKQLEKQGKAVRFANDTIEAELQSDVKKGVLHSFNIITSGAEVVNENEFLVSVQYEAQFGKEKGTTYCAEMVCGLSIAVDENYEVTETDVPRTYKLVDEKFFDSYSFIMDNPYVAYIEKKDVEGLSQENIAELLFTQWMDSMKEWKAIRSFKVVDVENYMIGDFLCADTAEWGSQEGWIGVRPIPRGSERSWIVGVSCDFKYFGFTDSVGLGDVHGGGAAFGNDGNWIRGEVFSGVGKEFILAEWKDFYTLETKTHCLESLGA